MTYHTRTEAPSQTPITHMAGSIISALTSLMEIALLLRFFFRLFGANPGAGFVSFIYNITHPLVSPFFSIFSLGSARAGVAVQSVFEPATLIAFVVLGIVGWLLARAFSGDPYY